MSEPSTVKALRILAGMMREEGYRPDDNGIEALCLEEAAAENERLREALTEIAVFHTDENISNEECMRDIARAALKENSDE